MNRDVRKMSEQEAAVRCENRARGNS